MGFGFRILPFLNAEELEFRLLGLREEPGGWTSGFEGEELGK